MASVAAGTALYNKRRHSGEGDRSATPSPVTRVGQLRRLNAKEEAAEEKGRTRLTQKAIMGGDEKSPQKWLIDPRSSAFMGYWDVVGLIALIFTAIVTPFEISHLSSDLNALFFVNRVVDAVFVTDLVLQFFLVYEDMTVADACERWAQTAPTLSTVHARRRAHTRMRHYAYARAPHSCCVHCVCVLQVTTLGERQVEDRHALPQRLVPTRSRQLYPRRALKPADQLRMLPALAAPCARLLPAVAAVCTL